MKKYILHSIFLFIIVACLPSTGLALNSAAHIYVTQEVFGSNDTDLLYGSIAPDLSTYVPYATKWQSGFEDTHYNYIILKPQGWTEPWKRFNIGWMVHNEEWGADWYSHIEYTYQNGYTGNGYVIDKASMLLNVLGQMNIYLPGSLDMQMMIAHNTIEFAIDMLIQDNLDTNLGTELFNVALNRSDEDVRRLFNILVAKGKVTDKETLYQSEAIFRNLILGFSSALAASNSDNQYWPLALFGSQMATDLYGVDITPYEVAGLLQIAMSICSDDFEQFLDDTVDGIRADLGID
jgi:hypothetical protein